MVLTFKAKTTDGYIIKILAELLQHCLKSGCFELDKDGMKLSTVDHAQRLLIDLHLKNDSFLEYRCCKKQLIGVNVVHLYRMLKSIKKKDSVTLFIDKEKEDYLGVTVEHPENKRRTTSYIKFQKVQYVKMILPGGYGEPNVIKSNEYQKLCKDLSSIGKIVKVYSNGPSYIKFSCDGGDIYSRDVELGGDEEDIFEDDDEARQIEEYEAEFNTQQLTQLMKVAGLSHHMHIYTTEGLPLKFKLGIGSLGTLEIFIKSRQLIDADRHTDNYYPDSDSDDNEKNYQSQEEIIEEEEEEESGRNRKNIVIKSDNEEEPIKEKKPRGRKKFEEEEEFPKPRGRKKKFSKKQFDEEEPKIKRTPIELIEPESDSDEQPIKVVVKKSILRRRHRKIK
jgi:proliferating cell nuclear antigen PCNA